MCNSYSSQAGLPPEEVIIAPMSPTTRERRETEASAFALALMHDEEVRDREEAEEAARDAAASDDDSSDDDDDAETYISEEAARLLTSGLSDALEDPRIDQSYITYFGAPYNSVLANARSTVSSVSGWGCAPYKVGITRGLVHRYCKAEYRYSDQYGSMVVLLCSTPAQCVKLEKQLILDFRTGEGPPNCQNKAKGGESPPKTAHCFTYVVV